MAPDLLDIPDLLRRVQVGDKDAAGELVDLFHDQVLRRVRRLLHPYLRSQVDSTDLTQEVWAAFFVHVADGLTFRDRHHVVVFLLGTTCKMVLAFHRRHLDTEGRDVRREEPLETAAQVCFGLDPAAVAQCIEEWTRALHRLYPKEREVLLRSGAGQNAATIAQDFKTTERTIQRIRRIAFRKFSGFLTADC